MKKLHRKTIKPPKRILAITLLIVVIIIVIIGFIFSNINKTPSLKIYFLKEDSLVAVLRPIKEGEDILSKTAFELLKGPTKEEVSRGYFTEIPKRARVLSLKKEGTLLRINFNRDFENYGGGSARVLGLVGQIIYTFTETSDIETILIMIEGKEEVVLGGEGYVIDHPLSRSDIKL
ncbi:hypothetical protein A2526_02600 [candidate division WOR-1 bacterium RIFOXYD2_FULL_36_8]|uniref:GerMN domain-containing protein n=1 Tax=candidate division WOR-1 bacterium RIFOXYB2_FULL_36_35 TaxID=1802578 RepID=A0A1F4S0L4_UNCSA|nr:MAG: hypothetical protein A2230_09220 [candidate division WOR-1 bacterium RIFOXYA2_FULL_36_21]OGC13985.1 MAG: hypothetical protein A2290_04235 [candidate division WOR-1 bacterium RIFOXYB2_FULL_36_35]OGC16608.1 MAG: hypothetical protein A2282_02535 [candidate division WOR-1 bacterium RIFOXYA12_FULL_36_13]OGC41218.1 MAG: hypothetical protein A2526_02600 [candidate division WOR-1 bacterium RIFOXYD2_FULL_36_8]